MSRYIDLRLRQDKGGGAWCPRNMVTKEGKEYLEVNLHTPRLLTSTKTQGRFGNGNGVEYTEEYFVEYWRPGFNKWVRWRNRRGVEHDSIHKSVNLEVPILVNALSRNATV
ncbi:Discoidin domain-containing receptor 2 [Temnothorax longispinosus]|uniref:Discoidin domain-containing receptor 2 n=1 Tax=Temnothorax longispinosus TaxID=300112 RepID=A0A4S2KLS2_9HYME|nr:Discoidin domain-containing receptor 2 [Temnothorax longispinosus]